MIAFSLQDEEPTGMIARRNLALEILYRPMDGTASSRLAIVLKT